MKEVLLPFDHNSDYAYAKIATVCHTPQNLSYADATCPEKVCCPDAAQPSVCHSLS